MRNKLIAAGKTVKIMTVGRKGADNLRRDFGKNIVERIDFQGIKQLNFTPRRRHRQQSAGYVQSRRFRRRDALFLGIQVGHLAKADGAAADPGQDSGSHRLAATPRAQSASPRI